MICTVDPRNITGLDVTYPIQVEVEEKIKSRLFGRSIYRCKNLEPDGSIETLICRKNQLYPANMTVVRYPADLPIINDADVECVKFAISKLSNSDDKDNVNVVQLKQLYEKLDFCRKMRWI